MRLLGIDWGKSKVGVALAETILAEPLQVIIYEDEEKLFSELKKLVESHNIERVVVGESESLSANSAGKFAQRLQEKIGIEVVMHDETLSSHEAQLLSREAGIGRKKRKDMEDAYAASILLQSYLDSTTI